MPLFQSLQTARVSDGIARQIREVIFAGKLKPGDKLPTERELVEQFHSSRASVREAVRSLEHLGLIKIKRGAGGGTYISKANHRPVVESFRVRMQLNKGTVDHLTEARILLEPAVCRLAAKHADAKDLDRLQKAVEEQEALVQAGREVASYDLKFHRLLFEAAHNPVLELTTVSIIDLLTSALEQAHVGGNLTPHVVNFHRAIYNALSERDGDRAARLMHDHVADIQKRLRPFLIKGRGAAALVTIPPRLRESSWDQ